MNKLKSFTGVLFILIGIVFLLKQLGLISFSIFQGAEIYWPIGIIFTGLALMFRKGGLAFIFIILTFGFFIVSSNVIFEVKEQRFVSDSIPLDNVSALDVNIDFGGGDLIITGGSADLLDYELLTADINNPKVSVNKIFNKKSVSFERDTDGFQFWHRIDDEWNFKLNSDVQLNIDLDYGATDSHLDLSKLKVNTLDIDSGATSTKIIFADYPTKVDVDTGAASIELRFKKNTGVVIDIDGGALSKDLDGFRKENGKYYSANYVENARNIEIKINAGATSIDAEFY